MSDMNNEDVNNEEVNNEEVITIVDGDQAAPKAETEKNEEKTGKRKREVKVRSKAWEHFKKIPPKFDSCKCNYCNKVFSCRSSGGTTHLTRHITDGICPEYRKAKGDQELKGQTLLNFAVGKSDEGNKSVWKFDQERSRKDLTELIINRELPFNFVEDKSFQKYALNLNPKVKFVSRNTMRSDCIKLYEAEKNKLKELFLQSRPRMCFTTDTWTSKQDLPFMALTAHFIDKEWKLQKKIINFVLVPLKATGENLSDIIINCLLEWNLDRICTITMDNASANDVVARCLQEHYSSRGMLLLDGKKLQVRCWGHILNLIVQEGLDDIKLCIHRVRNAVKYVKASPKRKLEFLEYAEQERIPKGKMLVLDVCTRWNSTYLMLESALHYRKAYDRMRSRDLNFKDPPLVEDWEKAQIVHGFLETFYTVTKIFSGSKYCTANVFLREIYRIFMLLRETGASESPLLGSMASNMLVKFEKYWSEKKTNILLSVAFVLDPRFKMKKLKNTYSKLYDSNMVPKLLDRVSRTLDKLLVEYSAVYEANCHEEASKKAKLASVEEKSDAQVKLKKNFMAEFYQHDDEDESSYSKSELDNYLEEKLYPSKLDEQDDFDVLDYWRANATKFPILSMMARDILAIPITSVASESAFSTGGRVLNKFRSSLVPSTVEALICAQDWIKEGLKAGDLELEFDSDFAASKSRK